MDAMEPRSTPLSSSQPAGRGVRQVTISPCGECDRPIDGRQLFECTTCRQRFHPACCGVPVPSSPFPPTVTWWGVCLACRAPATGRTVGVA
jgi:hypothetical protein